MLLIDGDSNAILVTSLSEGGQKNNGWFVLSRLESTERETTKTLQDLILVPL